MTIYASPLLQLLADRAHDATRPGPCGRCPHGVHPGQRIARLATGQWVHAWCAASMPPVRAARRPAGR
jgi:hypothetical protein